MITPKEKLELIFELLGIIATFSAVFVALWQTKIQFKKKLKIYVTEVIRLIDKNGIFDNGVRMLEVRISNIGNRDVIITDWGIYCSKKYRFQIFNNSDKNLPHALKLEDNFCLRTPIIGIKNALIENKVSIYKYKKVKIYVNDSTGKTYFKKTLRSVYEYINLKQEDVFISKEKLNNMG